MTAPLNVPLVVNSVLTPAAYFPGGAAVLTGVANTWNGNTYTLNLLGPDGLTTFATAITLAANGVSAVAYLPAGKYSATQSGASTGAYVNLQAVPTNLN